MKQIGNEALDCGLERKLRLIEVAAGRRPAEL